MDQYTLYSLIQSTGNSYGGDVVWYNKTFRDEDNILDRIYGSKCVLIIIMVILKITLYENIY